MAEEMVDTPVSDKVTEDDNIVEETVDAPVGGDAVTEDDRLWALLCHIFCPLVGIIVLLLDDKKDRPFVKYNAVVSIILGIVAFILIPFCGIGFLVWFYVIYLGIKSYQGEWIEVPAVSDLVREQGWA